MERAVKLLIILVVIAIALLAFQLKQSPADVNKFDGVVNYSMDALFGKVLAFFNQNDGKIYFYQKVNGKQIECIEVLQIDELGKPIRIIEKDTALSLF